MALFDTSLADETTKFFSTAGPRRCLKKAVPSLEHPLDDEPMSRH